MDHQLDHAAARLLGQGYAVVRGAAPASLVAALGADLDNRFAATPYCDGDFYGRRTKRFGSLLIRSPRAAAFVQHPIALGLAEHALGCHCDRIALNLCPPRRSPILAASPALDRPP